MFKKTKTIERQIDEFLDAVNEGALVFRDAVDAYLDGRLDDFRTKRTLLESLETRADHLSREVETLLYTHSLIPEHRGDILGLLEHTDDIVDRAKYCLQGLDVERPDIPPRWHDHYRRLAATAYQAAEAVIIASRRSFRDPDSVSDHLFKVHHFEGECDQIGLGLRQGLFADADLDLARRQHLRYFVEAIDRVADLAEAVADRLAIYAIKRRM